MEERKFKVGDKITYKSRKACGDRYEFGGEDHGGFVGKIKSYGSYYEKFKCYEINVTAKSDIYLMLESEFEEYDSSDKEPTYSIY
jgi:hypothetical protein